MVRDDSNLSAYKDELKMLPGLKDGRELSVKCQVILFGTAERFQKEPQRPPALFFDLF